MVTDKELAYYLISLAFGTAEIREHGHFLDNHLLLVFFSPVPDWFVNLEKDGGMRVVTLNTLVDKSVFFLTTVLGTFGFFNLQMFVAYLSTIDYFNITHVRKLLVLYFICTLTLKWWCEKFGTSSNIVLWDRFCLLISLPNSKYLFWVFIEECL